VLAAEIFQHRGHRDHKRYEEKFLLARPLLRIDGSKEIFNKCSIQIEGIGERTDATGKVTVVGGGFLVDKRRSGMCIWELAAWC